MPAAIQIVLIAVVAAAAVWDVRTRRIPNELIVAGALSGLVLHGARTGVEGVLISLEGGLFGFALFIVFFLVRGMGAGDVKLFAAVGALVGPQILPLVFVFTALIGGIAAAVVILRYGWDARLPYGAV